MEVGDRVRIKPSYLSWLRQLYGRNIEREFAKTHVVQAVGWSAISIIRPRRLQDERHRFWNIANENVIPVASKEESCQCTWPHCRKRITT